MRDLASIDRVRELLRSTEEISEQRRKEIERLQAEVQRLTEEISEQRRKEIERLQAEVQRLTVPEEDGPAVHRCERLVQLLGEYLDDNESVAALADELQREFPNTEIDPRHGHMEKAKCWGCGAPGAVVRHVYPDATSPEESTRDATARARILGPLSPDDVRAKPPQQEMPRRYEVHWLQSHTETREEYGPREAVRSFFRALGCEPDAVDEVDGTDGWIVIGICEGCGLGILEGDEYSSDGEGVRLCGTCGDAPAATDPDGAKFRADGGAE